MIGNLGQGPPKVGGLLETVEMQGRVINVLARYIEELRAFYANRCEQLERQIFGDQPSPGFPTFAEFMEKIENSPKTSFGEQQEKIARGMQAVQGAVLGGPYPRG